MSSSGKSRIKRPKNFLVDSDDEEEKFKEPMKLKEIKREDGSDDENNKNGPNSQNKSEDKVKKCSVTLDKLNIKKEGSKTTSQVRI